MQSFPCKTTRGISEALESDRNYAIKQGVREINEATLNHAALQAWRCTGGIPRKTGYKKMKYASSQISLMKFDSDGQPIKCDSQWGEVKIKHFATIERAEIMGWGDLKDMYNVEIAYLHQTYCSVVPPDAVIPKEDLITNLSRAQRGRTIGP